MIFLTLLKCFYTKIKNERGCMLLKGSISSEKTSMLVEKYAELLNSGVDSSKILVIVQNSNKKNQFIKEVLEKLTVDSIEKLQIYSFFGLVYNTISDNWAFIENSIKVGETSILPNLVGLEVSQFIMREILCDVKFEGYNSKKSLLHQLFRRYSLIVQNNLTDEDVDRRSEILKEGFAPDAKKVLAEFKLRTLEARGLDYLRQSLIFNHIYKNTNYFANIEYIFVDDGDEITPICYDFIEYLKPKLKDVFIAYDKDGGSRLGYLSAKKKAVFEFEKLFNQDSTQLTSHSSLANDAQTIFNNVIEEKYDKLKNFSLLSYSKRAQMLDNALSEIKSMIKKGIKPSEISIITPIVDDMFKFSLKENLKMNWVNLLFLSGSEKLVQNPLVLASLTMLKLCDADLRKNLSEFEIRAILSNFLHIPLKYCKEILENFEKTKTFIDYEFALSEYSEKYQKFLKLLETLGKNENKLSEQVYEIYENLVDFRGYSPNELNKFNFFIKQLEDFENVFSKEIMQAKKSDIILQIENSIIAENPYSTLEIQDNDLIVATPQKIIDNQIQTKYQFWLDISNDEWIKSDTGPLYNAWVFQAGWDKPEYTLKDNIELGKQKTARILRKLALCANNQVYAYASLFDGSGIENYGGIERYLKFDAKITSAQISKPIIPRDDQKPVLDYKKGQMAISAVPGAGKTTILLALIIKLLNEGINPENIFVLTYMESAARNFRERIQNASQEISQLPNISTIHGLALKILKENGNFERLGLNADFEICDDTQRSRILREISTKLKIKPKEQEDFDRAVSVFKIGGSDTLTPNPSPLKGEGNNPLNITPCCYSKETLNHAKELRRKQTEPEEILWFLLRNNNFCNLKFKRQAPFGKYIVDFICLEKKLVIELDGAQHLQESNILHDNKRKKYIEEEGYKIIRFYNSEIFNNIESVLEKLYHEINPSPLRGEGQGVRVSQTDKKVQNFLAFFKEYQTILKSNNLIDYDDMLIFSVKLLEENPDILAFYQDLCRFVIEDEAQDSSAVQQKLINLLSAKHKNLIRCGDINQAITTTFSNADVEGFRKFIQNSETTVSMDRSQRCTKDVWTLANSLVTFAETKPESKNAFYKIFMRPVDNQNPDEKNAIRPMIFTNSFAERNYILKQIKDLLTKNPKATFGILLRNNYQVGTWTKFINDAGLKSITRSECLEQKGVFRTIFAILNMILHPFDNEVIAKHYETLAELGLYEKDLDLEIKKYETPFVQMSADDIENDKLAKFYWDLTYWMSFAALPPEELAIKIGLYYYSSEVEKSNVYLISTLIKRLSLTHKNFSTLVERLLELSKKPSLSGFKFFSEEDETNKEFMAGKIQIMTLHKSKGDEFDYVFLPEMTEKSLSLDFSAMTLKGNTRFMENIREFNPNYKPKSDNDLKEFLLAENFRLLYVAITRAKRKLFISVAKTSQSFGKTISQDSSIIFKSLLKAKEETDA